MLNAISTIIGILILLLIARQASKNLRTLLRNEKDLYKKSYYKNKKP